MAADTIEEGTPVGECLYCGPVYGDSVHVRFPEKAKCNLCGSDLIEAGLADKEVDVPEQIARVNNDE